MPEGDTIHRSAATLRRALAGRTLTRLEAPRLARAMPPPGTAVEDVRARGKHLLVVFDDDHVLHTHMRMTGSWHVYRARARWQRGRSRMRALLADEQVQAVCFDAPVVELLDRAALERHPSLSRLGPDLCQPDVDLEAALARMGRVPEPDRALVEVLLDQRVAAGVGNVFASELAFLAGRHPLTPLAAIDVDTRSRSWPTPRGCCRPTWRTPAGPRCRTPRTAACGCTDVTAARAGAAAPGSASRRSVTAHDPRTGAHDARLGDAGRQPGTTARERGGAR